MFSFLDNILDSIVDCFTLNMRWSQLLRVYWYLFFIEFPRYYLLEVIMVVCYKFCYRSRRKDKQEARRILYIENPLVTILAPGKNEGKHIFRLVQSLRAQTYRNVEIIIVDDGSDDATRLICTDLEKDGYIDRYLRLSSRGGKASAANYGASMAHGKYIVHLDADSSLDRDALENILIPFYYDRQIKGVGGCVKVRNGGDSLCSSMQQLEYLKTIQVGRLVTSWMGIYHIISGAFGAFEKKALEQVGYWDIGPGLDGDITQKLRKAGWKVHFAEDAICMTNVPVKWYQLFKQRYRWSRSLVRFRLRKHKDILLPTKNFSFLNFMSNLENVLYDFAFNYIWVFYIFTLLFNHTEHLWEILVIGWLIRLSFSLVAFAVILLVSERADEEWKLVRYLPFQTLYTGYFLRLTRLIAHTSELFFFTSYRDAWNPKKTSEVAQVEHL